MNVGLFGRPLFHSEQPEDSGGAPPEGGEAAPEAAWAPTEEWGQRIDGFIESAGPVLANLNELLSAPEDPYAGYQQQQGSGDPAYDQWLSDYQQWSVEHGNGSDPYGVLGQQQQQFDPQRIAGIVEQAMSPYAPMLQEVAELGLETGFKRCSSGSPSSEDA